MLIFLQFTQLLSFGIAGGMICTSARLVPSGFFRVHSYVLLGLSALGAMIGFGLGHYWIALVLAALCSYLASACWLLELHNAGRLFLIAAALLAAVTACLAGQSQPLNTYEYAASAIGWIASGMVLGACTSAMLLGHWYLNTPTMQLAPLRRLMRLTFGALAARAAVSAAAAYWLLQSPNPLDAVDSAFLALRWFAGLVGTTAAAFMAWKTLDIPNTQSATGILYVCVITSFLGELAALLLSSRTGLPL